MDGPYCLQCRTDLENFKIGDKVSEKETTNNSTLLFFKYMGAEMEKFV